MAAHWVGVPATAIAFSGCSCIRTGTCAMRASWTSRVRFASSSAVGGSPWRWRSEWRTTPICVDTWAAEVTSSVEPPPMSMTRNSPARPCVAPS